MRLFEFKKQEIVTTVFILCCLAGYVFFPANGKFQYRAVAIIFLVLLPFLYNKYFLKKENIFKEIVIGDYKKNSTKLFACLFFSLLIMAFLFKYSDLREHYLLSPVVKNDFWQFLLYEFTGVVFTVAIYEFFFRGFVQNYFRASFGKWAILLQFLFFVIMISILGLPYWFYVTYLIFMPFAGWLACESDSLTYSFIGQMFFIVIFDASFIALSK